jgi:hypothetical protein
MAEPSKVYKFEEITPAGLKLLNALSHEDIEVEVDGDRHEVRVYETKEPKRMRV